MINDKKKTYTIGEFQALKQEVINLRQLSVAEAGSERHEEILKKLCRLEEELLSAQILPSDTQKNKIFIEPLDNDNIIPRKR